MTQANGTPSETATTTAAKADSESSAVASLGDKLRCAREQRSLSLEQVAETLHLDEAIVVSLEQGHFEALGAPVYVRGHLKTYARLLGLSPDDIVSEYLGDNAEPFMAPTLQQPGVVAPTTVNPVLLAGGGLTVVLSLLLGLYVVFGGDKPVDTRVAENSDAVPVVETPALAVPEAVEAVRAAPAVPRVVDAQQLVTESPQPAVQTAIAAVTLPPVPVDRPVATMRLGLQFTQESWVEISDANRRLLFGLQHAGDRREISGEPPFNLLIGNAHAVELTINDEPFEVPAARVRGKVARFKITGEEIE